MTTATSTRLNCANPTCTGTWCGLPGRRVDTAGQRACHECRTGAYGRAATASGTAGLARHTDGPDAGYTPPAWQPGDPERCNAERAPGKLCRQPHPSPGKKCGSGHWPGSRLGIHHDPDADQAAAAAAVRELYDELAAREAAGELEPLPDDHGRERGLVALGFRPELADTILTANPHLATTVAKLEHVPAADVIDQLARHPDTSVAVKVLDTGWPLPPDTLTDLAAVPDAKIADALAHRDDLPAAAARVIIERWTAGQVASGTHQRVLRALPDDEAVAWMRDIDRANEGWKVYTVVTDPRCPTDVLEAAVRNAPSYVPAADVAGHPNVNPATLAALLDAPDRERRVWLAAAANPALPTERHAAMTSAATLAHTGRRYGSEQAALALHPASSRPPSRDELEVLLDGYGGRAAETVEDLPVSLQEHVRPLTVRPVYSDHRELRPLRAGIAASFRDRNARDTFETLCDDDAADSPAALFRAAETARALAEL